MSPIGLWTAVLKLRVQYSAFTLLVFLEQAMAMFVQEGGAVGELKA